MPPLRLLQTKKGKKQYWHDEEYYLVKDKIDGSTTYLYCRKKKADGTGTCAATGQREGEAMEISVFGNHTCRPRRMAAEHFAPAQEDETKNDEPVPKKPKLKDPDDEEEDTETPFMNSGSTGIGQIDRNAELLKELQEEKAKCKKLEQDLAKALKNNQKPKSDSKIKRVEKTTQTIEPTVLECDNCAKLKKELATTIEAKHKTSQGDRFASLAAGLRR